MKPEVTLMGAGSDRTEVILEGTGLYTIIDADNCRIQGLTIINSDAAGTRSAIFAESNNSKITHCTLRGSYEGILITGKNIEISNSIVVNNDAGIRNNGSNSKIYNNTIMHNRNGGILGNGANATIKNNIVISPVQVLSDAAFQNNNVFERTNYSTQPSHLPDQTGINGNISLDPLFVNAAAGDYRLSINSPCINAGSDVGIPANGFSDIGAFEYNGTGIIRVESNHSNSTFTITGPQNYTGSGIGWSSSNVPIGIYGCRLDFTLRDPIYAALA